MSTPILTQIEPLLSQEEVAQFGANGFIGPFDGSMPEATIDAVAQRLERMIFTNERHPLYERFSVRDWHLLDAEMLQLFADPAVVGRLTPLLGKDLTLWRTKVFRKRPGEGPIGWHQEWGAFNGEEIGNDVPGLRPAPDAAHQFWNLTVWIALEDIDEEMGPIHFARGTHQRRFPIAMAPMSESEFWHDPFLDVDDPRVLIERANNSSLVLDVDTSQIFAEADSERLTLEDVKERILAALSNLYGAVTLEFDPAQEEIITMPMHKGQFVIFTERTMHGSSSNRSPRRRLAINGRVTRSDTLVYPGRLRGEFVDGSNLDISHHRCVLLYGQDRCGMNVYDQHVDCR